MKHAIRRAEIYARNEVEAILSAPRQPLRPGVFNDGLCLRTATGRNKASEDR